MFRVSQWTIRSLLIVVLAAAIWGYWKWGFGPHTPQHMEEHDESAIATNIPGPVRLSRQARENLGLTAKPLAVTSFWRTVELPGVIVDRPGISDRGVVAPVTGVVTKIEAFPGDTVEANAALFAIRLVSESLHAAQMELFKASQNIAIANDEFARLSAAAQSGALPKARIIEIENEIKRLKVSVQAYEQGLRARGLTPEGIEAAARGEFASEIIVRAPEDERRPNSQPASTGASAVNLPTFEVHALKVELGAQVEAGQLLCELADHRALFIEGRAFKDDLPPLQTAAKNGWEVELDFGSEEGDWPSAPSRLPIHHVANAVDPATRTFAFYLALENHSQSYVTPEGKSRLLWRFRPGGRLRLRVPVEELKNVFVVPREAVVQEGPEAFIFRQNGDLFDRRPVRLLHEDRLYAVLANDGSVRPGFYVAQNGAASLNRVLKAQSASGTPAGVHVHADGTVHGAH